MRVGARNGGNRADLGLFEALVVEAIADLEAEHVGVSTGDDLATFVASFTLAARGQEGVRRRLR